MLARDLPQAEPETSWSLVSRMFMWEVFPDGRTEGEWRNMGKEKGSTQVLS